MIIAIHQPHYLPWLGFLDKMAHADIFVILDDVQLTEKSPMHRNKFIDRCGNEILLSVDLYKKGYPKKDELMLSICKCCDADIYLSGKGAKKYMNDKIFWDEGIEVLYQNFSYPEYNQKNSPNKFVPNLSALDILFNCGIDKSREIFRNQLQVSYWACAKQFEQDVKKNTNKLKSEDNLAWCAVIGILIYK